jgi:hypothetical protein
MEVRAMGDVQSRHGGAFRAIGLGLAGLVVALSLVGCWWDSATTKPGRDLHTATLLSDGRVLIAGGSNSNIPAILTSAELYDPKIGTFGPTGPMTVPRSGHTATLLADGRVLVAGGRNVNDASDWSYLSSAELYDPKTGTFSPTGSMATARDLHTATLLSDGRVLIAGGYAGGNSLSSAELYDPATGTFSPTGSMGAARWFRTATLLSDGRVLMAGGNADGKVVASAELYDPKTGKFSPTGSMATGREWHTATLLSDGRVLIAGGDNGVPDPASYLPSALASAELYDPATGAFTLTGPLAPATQ